MVKAMIFVLSNSFGLGQGFYDAEIQLLGLVPQIKVKQIFIIRAFSTSRVITLIINLSRKHKI